MSVEIFGRDDELGALNSFLDPRPGTDRGAFVLEGEAGMGKSTLWLAGVETAREREFRVLLARPAEVELGIAHVGWEDATARAGARSTS